MNLQAAWNWIAAKAKNAPRLSDWIVYAIVLLVILFFAAPQVLPTIVAKLTQAALAGLVGYRFDRSIFPYGRPDKIVDDPEGPGEWTLPEAIAFGFATLRRALIVSACIVGVLLGI